jgi:Peptidase family M28
LRNRTDFYVYPAFNSSMPLVNFKEIIFVGYGIEDGAYNDYQKADVEGKAVIFYDGEPLSADGKSLITGTEMRSNWSVDWKRKVRLAKQKGASIVFIIDPKFDENLKNNRKLIQSMGWKPAEKGAEKPLGDMVNSIFVSPLAAKALLGDKSDKVENELSDLRSGEKFKPVKIKNKIEVRMDKESQTLEGSNVLAVIEGSDETLKKEYVMITAHYDHLGIVDSSVIYHGADDNASGTAAVIEIAKAFYEAKKQGKGPKRTVICMLVSGEEKGLLGSKFYVEFPLFPLEKTVAEINIDMIGRVDAQHASNPDYIYVIGSDRLSTDLHRINENNNQLFTKLELDYRYNAKDDPNHYYERSDHYNFAERGIPSIFYFNGTHPDYHRPSDTIEKINFEAMVKRAQLAFYTAWEIANRPLKPAVDKK